MLNPFQAIKKIEVRRFASLPAKFRKKRRTAWSDPNRQGAPVDSFLEGPSFDRQGNLVASTSRSGRIFKIDPKGEWELVAQYDGWPNGLKFHKDGRAWIADYKRGLLRAEPEDRRIEPSLETAFSEGFKGLNDLHFADNGDLYFTDQGQSGIADPSGRVYRLQGERRAAAPGDERAFAERHHAEHEEYAGLRRDHALAADLAPAADGGRHAVEDRRRDPALGRPRRARRHRDGRRGRPASSAISASASGASTPTACRRISRMRASDHRLMTNIAFRGKTLYITDSMNGEILTADMPVAGKKMFSRR